MNYFIKKLLRESLLDANQPMYFLRWTESPNSDIERGFSGHMQAWWDTEEEAMADAQENGNPHSFPPRQDPVSGMWNSDPEWGLSAYAFSDESSFNHAMSEIDDIAWYHKDSNGQDLVVFESNEYLLEMGFDGEDVFRNPTRYWYVDEGITFEDFKSIMNEKLH